MALPPTVRVKLSSEAAGSISLTPVVVQEFAVRDLVENILAVTGKDESRVGDHSADDLSEQPVVRCNEDRTTVLNAPIRLPTHRALRETKGGSWPGRLSRVGAVSLRQETREER